jgi:hypothetical protein
LHLILARHFGYWFRKTQPGLDLQNADDASLKDAYLDRTVPDWRKEARKNPEKANLCNAELGGAHLEGADLVDAELSLADLEGAHLRGTNLKGAVLRGADLKAAILVDADLKGADLEAAVLNGAVLNRAILVDAVLRGADLKGAVLKGADLNGADLFRASLSVANLSAAKVGKAKLSYADLTGATYGPASEPPDPYVAGIKGLATLTTPYDEQIGLVQLRKLLRDAGLEEDEREVTSSIQRNRTGDDLSTISSRFWSFAWIDGVLRYAGLYARYAAPDAIEPHHPGVSRGQSRHHR